MNYFIIVYYTYNKLESHILHPSFFDTCAWDCHSWKEQLAHLKHLPQVVDNFVYMNYHHFLLYRYSL